MKISLFVLIFLFTIFANESQATPSYARNLKVSCTQCHSLFPNLNKYGRNFKEELAAKLKQDVADTFQAISNPLSARIKLRPYDKSTDQDKPSQRAFHEAEIMLTGRTSKLFYMAEIEAEDETPRADGFGFDTYISHAYAGFNINRFFNVITGFANPLTQDTLGTVDHSEVMRGAWKATEFMPGRSQFVGFAGYAGNLTYLASFYGDAYEEGTALPSNGPEGKDPRNYTGRLSYKVMGQNIGVLYAKENGGDTKRFAVDGLIEYGSLTTRLVYAVKDEKTAAALRDKNHDISLEAYYALGDFTPMLGLDKYTTGDGRNSYTNGQFALFYNIEDNMRVDVNYETKISVAQNEANTGRLTLRGEFAF